MIDVNHECDFIAVNAFISGFPRAGYGGTALGRSFKKFENLGPNSLPISPSVVYKFPWMGI